MKSLFAVATSERCRDALRRIQVRGTSDAPTGWIVNMSTTPDRDRYGRSFRSRAAAASAIVVGTQTSGQISITKDLQVPISGRDLLLVEDIEDTGTTLQVIQNHLRILAPRTIKVCTLIDKREPRLVNVHVD